MVVVRSFSIEWKRDLFLITLLGVTPRGKEKVIKIFLPPAEMEALASKMKEALEKKKMGLPPQKELDYIG